MFTVIVNIDGLERKMNTLAEQASELDQPLKIFGGYLRKRALERFRAQDFPPLANVTIERRAHDGIRKLEHKLHKDLRRAMARAPRSDLPRGLLARVLGIPKSNLTDVETRGVKNRLAVLAEFQRRHRPSGSLASMASAGELSFKQHSSLVSRETRAVVREIGKPILGALTRSLMLEPGNGQITVRERTHQQFTEIHNRGGTAGHGARIPQRETLKIENEDLGIFEAILRGHLLDGFDD